MSNPSDTGDARTTPDDSDPVTEVIDIYAAPDTGEALTGERRYTAPGFDAGSTQIIDRVPDPPTELIETDGPPHRTAAPRNIPPRPRLHRRPAWRLPVILVAGGLILAAALTAFVVKRSEANARAAQENAVRASIESFDTAIRTGDLATLRSITCGATRDAYVNYDQNAWADAYARVAEAKQYPVVASIDEVVVHGDRAEANVTSYLASDPSNTSTRSFDLQFRDEQWKICQAS